tara:strand:+ start:1583 stop:1903 length:321 start_codon:yes stop_codon:yes gene_type:complete
MEVHQVRINPKTRFASLSGSIAMPLRGCLPPSYEHEVVIADGRSHVQGTLLGVSDDLVRIRTTAIIRQGPLRVFPVHAEKDGLYEIQGYFLEQKNLEIILTLQKIF